MLLLNEHSKKSLKVQSVMVHNLLGSAHLIWCEPKILLRGSYGSSFFAHSPGLPRDPGRVQEISTTFAECHSFFCPVPLVVEIGREQRDALVKRSYH